MYSQLFLILRVKTFNVSSPYKNVYKTWLFKWIVYNRKLSYSKKEFIEHKIWKQHLMVIFSISFSIGVLILIIKKILF